LGAGGGCVAPHVAPHATPHATSLGGSKPRVPTHKHVSLTFPGGGVPGGRAGADIERVISDRWPLRRSCGAHGACRDAPPAPTVVKCIVEVAHQRRGADMTHNYVAGQNCTLAPKVGGGCLTAASPCTASVRNHPPSPATCNCSCHRSNFCSRGEGACVHPGRHRTHPKIWFSGVSISKLVFWGGCLTAASPSTAPVRPSLTSPATCTCSCIRSNFWLRRGVPPCTVGVTRPVSRLVFWVLAPNYARLVRASLGRALYEFIRIIRHMYEYTDF
jgi:hypothetical protein